MVDTVVGIDSPSYTPVTADVAANIYCRVTATNAAGSASANSNTVGPVTAASGGGEATTFDPANKSTNVTLSGSNLIATLTSDGRGGARSIASVSSPSKIYFEITCGAVTTAAANIIGLANATNGLESFPGSDLNGVGFAFGGGVVYINNSTVTAIGYSLSAGQRLGVAVDLGAKRMWLRQGGVWDGVGSLPDPVTGADGIPLDTVNAGPYYVFVSQVSNTDAVTLNFGPTFTDTPPTGYGMI